jgi:tRNA(Ile)-lysidine synthase
MMYKDFRQFILSLDGYSKNIKIGVSYSGGPDSGVLLHLFIRLFKEGLSVEPDIIYFDHGLRGEESKKENIFVRKTAVNYGLKLIEFKLDVKDHSAKYRLSTESAARDLRYSNYEKLKNYYDYIAQGHHASDNAETVFYNIIRGTGLEGAAGIKKVRDKFIRPLLGSTKSEILEYARENNIEFIEDRTNMESDFSRNKIRNILIPAIEKELGRKIIEPVNRFSQICSESADYIGMQASKTLKKCSRDFHGVTIVNKRLFLNSEPVIRKAIINLIFKNTGTGYSLNSYDTNSLASMIGTVDDLKFESCGITVSSYRNNLLFIPDGTFNPAKISFSRTKFSDLYIDISKTQGVLRSETANHSDKFIPFGKNREEKLSKTFSDKKIPQILRDRMICLKDDEKVIFVQGCGISDSVKISDSTPTDSVRFVSVSKDMLSKLYSD